jgi:hypothetical protein
MPRAKAAPLQALFPFPLFPDMSDEASWSLSDRAKLGVPARSRRFHCRRSLKVYQ